MGMRAAGAEVVVLALALLAAGLGSGGGRAAAELQVGFYRKTCPRAETIVRRAVEKAVEKDPELAADFVRMHFHDCFVRGCDGSILLDSTPSNRAEKDSPINNPSLEGYDVIDDAKAELEMACGGVVSCADIVAFAARDSVELSKGIRYEVPSGRRDGKISRSSETFKHLPPATFNLERLTKNFAAKGLSQEDMVTLSGAHSIGISHCTSISSRLYNFSSSAATDPSLDRAYAKKLKERCPAPGTDPSLTVPMDPRSPGALDSSYYENILLRRGLFQSDQTLMSSDRTARQVREFAYNQYLFQKKFAQAMVKMGKIDVITGKNRGEIRLNCRVVNSH